MKYYNQSEVPSNKPIYGLAYDINDDTENKRLICKPVLGEVIKNEGRSISCKLWSNYVFIPYKSGTTVKRKSGYVDFRSRIYADTYTEAVEMYNELVKQRIDNLHRLIDLAEQDYIFTL